MFAVFAYKGDHVVSFSLLCLVLFPFFVFAFIYQAEKKRKNLKRLELF